MQTDIHSRVIHSSQDMEAIEMSSMIDDWLKKLWYIYTMEYYSAIRRDEILPFVTTWMDLEIIMLSENHMILLISGT